MSQWHRPYPDSASVLFRVAATIMTFSLAIIGAVVVVTMIQGDSVDRVLWLFLPVFNGLIAALSWRLGLIGLFVSDHGLQVKTLFRTRTVPWHDVAEFEVRRPWLPRLAPVRAHVLWILLRDGGGVKTPIWRLEPEVMLGRGWGAQRMALWPRAFDSMLANLRQKVRSGGQQPSA